MPPQKEGTGRAAKNEDLVVLQVYLPRAIKKLVGKKAKKVGMSASLWARKIIEKETLLP